MPTVCHVRWYKCKSYSGQEVFKSRGSGQVGSRVFQISWVGSGRVKICSNLLGQVGSGRVNRWRKAHGSGQVMTREKQVTRGSGQHDLGVVFADPRVGPAHPTRESDASKTLPVLLPKGFFRTDTQ